MESNESEKTMLSIALQFSKAPLPMLFSEAGRLIVFRLVQS